MSVELELDIMPLELAVCRMGPDAVLPLSILAAEFVSLTRTRDELSLVLPAELAPGGAETEPGWAALYVKGPLEFSLTGILASLAAPLAEAGVGIFALSTYDTDYLLVKKESLEDAVAALEGAGHRVAPEQSG